MQVQGHPKSVSIVEPADETKMVRTHSFGELSDHLGRGAPIKRIALKTQRTRLQAKQT